MNTKTLNGFRKELYENYKIAFEKSYDTANPRCRKIVCVKYNQAYRDMIKLFSIVFRLIVLKFCNAVVVRFRVDVGFT